MHYVQKMIMVRQSEFNTARYSDLRPASVESNLFSYHLGSLIARGYIKKQGNRYSLTPRGKLFVDHSELVSDNPRIEPKNINLLVIKNSFGEHLLYERKKQPFKGYIGFPYGKILLGETVHAAALRVLGQDFGIETSIKHVGNGYVTAYENDQLISQIFAHIFSGQTVSRDTQVTSYGRAFWGRVSAQNKDLLLPGVLDILRHSDSSQQFFIESTHKL